MGYMLPVSMERRMERCPLCKSRLLPKSGHGLRYMECPRCRVASKLEKAPGK